MDWLTFVSNTISTIIWPLLILFIAWKFKSEFSILLTNITRFEGPGFKFERELDKAKQLADERLPVAPIVNAIAERPKDGRLKLIEDLVAEAPGSAVLAMWQLVEEELGTAFGTNQKHPSGFGLSFTVPESLRPLYNQLRQIRNSAAHVPHGITEKESNQFITLSKRLLAAIDLLKNPDAELKSKKFITKQELLEELKGKSAAITSVLIPYPQPISISKDGVFDHAVRGVGMIVYLATGREFMLHVEDAELLLNDGVLNEMHIQISFAPANTN